MSDPMRYILVKNKMHSDLIEFYEGSWVKWEDYARLKAEVERLRIEVQKLTIALRTADRVIKPLRDATQKGGQP